MSHHDLIVALGSQKYRVERPFGAWPTNSGKVTDVTVGPGGEIHVMLRHDPLVDPDDARIIELDADGRFVKAWGGNDIADSHMMTATGDGRLFVVDRDMHEVIIFTKDGARLGSIGQRGGPGQPFNHPTDVALSPWGDIYVSDGYAASHVHRFAADGTHISTWGSLGSGAGEFGEPHAIWTLPDRRVVVVDRCNHRLQFFDEAGGFLSICEGFRRPSAIWGDALGLLYVTDEVPSLHCLAPDGTRLGRCRPMLNGAHGIFGTPSGDILLAEVNPSRLTRLVRLAD